MVARGDMTTTMMTVPVAMATATLLVVAMVSLDIPMVDMVMRRRRTMECVLLEALVRPKLFTLM